MTAAVETRERAVARAVCAVLGVVVPPADCELPRRVRCAAAAVIRARTGEEARALAEQWRVHGPELSPSMLIRAGLMTDLMLTVAEQVDWSAPREPAEWRAVKGVKTVSPPKVKTVVAPPAVVERPVPPRRDLPSVRPEVVRYACWFIDARWRMDTVAKLFDVDADALRDALGMTSADRVAA